MKRIFTSFFFLVFLVCSTTQLVCAMKRSLEENENKVQTIRPQRPLAEIVVSVPEEIWKRLFYFLDNGSFYEKGVSDETTWSAIPCVSQFWGRIYASLLLTEGSPLYCYITDSLLLRHGATLQVLNLDCNQSVTSKTLTHLTNLKRLSLENNTIITDEDIKKLTNLTELNLYDNTIITGNGVKFLTNLTDLDLRGTTTDFEEIEGLTKLKELKLNEFFPGHLLQHFTDLTILDLNSNELIKDENIRSLTKLARLDLGWGEGVTNQGLKDLTTLLCLCLDDNEVITNDGICNLTNLMRLDLYCNRLITGGGLKKLTNLTALSDNDERSGDFLLTNAELKCLTSLQYLNVGFMKGIDDDGIKGLTNLTSLNVLDNPTITLEGVKLLPNIKPEILETLMRIKDLKDRAHSRVENWRASLRVRCILCHFRYSPQSDSLSHVSSSRLIKRSMRISRTTLS